MQFAVPQFTDVEDKLIGPLTLKQFLILLGFAGILFFLWTILGANFVFYILAVPVAGIGVYVTFKKFNGRPFFAYLFPVFNFLIAPREMIFQREPAVIHFSAKQVKTEVKKNLNQTTEPAESRLKKLAYLLDQKFEQEKEMMEVTHFDVPERPVAKTAAQVIKSMAGKPKMGLPKQFEAPSVASKSAAPMVKVPEPQARPSTAPIEAESVETESTPVISMGSESDEPLKPAAKRAPRAATKPAPKRAASSEKSTFNPDNILRN